MSLNGMNITQAGSSRAGGAGGGFVSRLLGMIGTKQELDYRENIRRGTKEHSVDQNIRETQGKNQAHLDMIKNQYAMAEERHPKVYPDTYEDGPLQGQPHPQAGQPNPRANKLKYPGLAEKIQRQTKMGSFAWAAPQRQTTVKEPTAEKRRPPFAKTDPNDALRANNKYNAKGKRGWTPKPEGVAPYGQTRNKDTGAWEDIKDSKGNTSGPLYTQENEHEDLKNLAQWHVQNGGK